MVHVCHFDILQNGPTMTYTTVGVCVPHFDRHPQQHYRQQLIKPTSFFSTRLIFNQTIYQSLGGVYNYEDLNIPNNDRGPDMGCYWYVRHYRRRKRIANVSLARLYQ